MLILLPIATFIFVFLSLLGFEYTTGPEAVSLRGTFLKTATLLGAYMVLFSEVLSLFSSLNILSVSIFWCVAMVMGGYLGWRKGWLAQSIIAFRSKWQKPKLFDWIAGIILAIILSLLFVVAVKSPPNNNDSLMYHMSRVAHWIQNSSLRHYATAYQAQLFNPVFAELAIMHVRLFIGNDRLVNLIQWLSMFGSIMGVSLLAKMLGADKYGQWLAAAFVASIPMGILQSTSTQNDYVTAFWLVSTTVFTINVIKNQATLFHIIMFALALGLGMQTKGTFYSLALPLVFWISIAYLFRLGIKQLLLQGATISLIVIVLNAGFWGRDLITYGGIFGPKDWVAAKTGFGKGLDPFAGAAVRNLTTQFATPDDALNKHIVSELNSVFGKIDPVMAKFSLIWAWNHEDYAGSPLHILAILLSLFLVAILHKNIANKSLLDYALFIISIFISYSFIIGYDEFGVRYQLPWLVVAAPLVGVTLARFNPRLSITLTILMLLSAFPWVLFNRTRPLIAMRHSNDPFTIPCYAGCTTGSILNEPPESTLFAVWSDRKDSYIDSMKLVKSLDCKEIGLKLDSSDLEYAYWWLLDAPQSGRRLEAIETTPELERYLDPNFKACAIICTTCGDEQTTLNGLDLLSEFQRIKIYGSVK